MSDYEQFIANKSRVVNAEPVPMAADGIAEHLFPHQRDLVGWALRRGRAAIFAQTGLGKTAMFLEFARQASKHGRVLILSPLAVAEQSVREGKRFGVDVVFAKEDTGAPITITNYDMFHAFDPRAYEAVILDESSLIKNSTGATRIALTEAFSKTRWRLCCTATPAPNAFTELGTHSEFLGVKSHVEMLSEYFIHDGGDTSVWRLKGHAEQEFWRWVCSWGAVVQRPSDLGHSDEGYNLPPLRMYEHIISVDHKLAQAAGMLFADDVRSLADQRATRRATMDERVKVAAKIAAKTKGPVLIWGELNDECDAVTAAIPGAIQVAGSDTNEDKAERMLGFADKRIRVIVTKGKIAGWGLNWQHCHTMIFAGVSHSYEGTFQQIRRCWRFGQKKPVDVHVIRAETEGAIVENLKRKEADAERLAGEMVARVGAMMREEITSARREWNAYEPQVTMTIPAWLTSEAS